MYRAGVVRQTCARLRYGRLAPTAEDRSREAHLVQTPPFPGRGDLRPAPPAASRQDKIDQRFKVAPVELCDQPDHKCLLLLLEVDGGAVERVGLAADMVLARTTFKLEIPTPLAAPQRTCRTSLPHNALATRQHHSR